MSAYGLPVLLRSILLRHSRRVHSHHLHLSEPTQTISCDLILQLWDTARDSGHAELLRRANSENPHPRRGYTPDGPRLRFGVPIAQAPSLDRGNTAMKLAECHSCGRRIALVLPTTFCAIKPQ